MPETPIQHEITSMLLQLPDSEQRRVLEFARSLKKNSQRGVRGAALLRFAGTVDDCEGEKIARAIEGGCERVDTDGW